MTRSRLPHIALALLFSFSVAGCATDLFVKDAKIGKQPGSEAPTLVSDVRADHDFAWTADTFGPVPARLQARGDASCRAIGWERAIGYHPDARGLNDAPLPGGGFYCS